MYLYVEIQYFVLIASRLLCDVKHSATVSVAVYMYMYMFACMRHHSFDVLDLCYVLFKCCLVFTVFAV